MEAMTFVTEDRKTAQESTFPSTYTFDLFGGVDVSLTVGVWCYEESWIMWGMIYTESPNVSIDC